LLCATLVLSFGSKVLARFAGQGDGNIPNNLRWQIWEDAVRVWRDAPLWGHGLGTFAQIYPLYQTVVAHEQVILHPESSWLLWLDELGAVPVGLGAALLLYFIGRNVVESVQTGDRGFFVRAGAFAGVFGLLCHALWDVPAHRWGTAAFALALLAIACPPLHRRRQIRLDRLWAGAPLLIGGLWLMPFLGNAPIWSADGTRQMLSRLNYSPTATPLEKLQEVEAWFPLDAELHEQVGVREMVMANEPDKAWREFRIADRLLPASWAQPAMQGWLSREHSPGMSFHFWSLAIERADRRAPEIFLAAYRNSIDLPGGEAYWRDYAENNPEFLLCYADAVTSDEEGKRAFDHWWEARGNTTEALDSWETQAFYPALRRWGNRAELEAWIQRRPGLEATDYADWAGILHEWQLDADAWSILSHRIKEPAYPDAPAGEDAQEIETAYRTQPDDPIYAQAYARQCAVTGDAAKSEQVILAIAAGKNAPSWFIEKAAFLYAARKDYTTAVTSLLRLTTAGS